MRQTFVGFSREIKQRLINEDTIQYETQVDKRERKYGTKVWSLDRRFNFGIDWNVPADVDIKSGV